MARRHRPAHGEEKYPTQVPDPADWALTMGVMANAWYGGTCVTSVLSQGASRLMHGVVAHALHRCCRRGRHGLCMAWWHVRHIQASRRY